MSLRTWAVRSKPCFTVRSLPLACRRLPAQSLVLRFNRPYAIAGYATSTNTSNEKNNLAKDTANPSDKISIDRSTSKQARQGVPLESEDTPAPVLRENIYTIPNLLTVSRIVSCPFLGYFIVNGNFVAATSLLFYAGVSDLVGFGR